MTDFSSLCISIRLCQWASGERNINEAAPERGWEPGAGGCSRGRPKRAQGAPWGDAPWNARFARGDRKAEKGHGKRAASARPSLVARVTVRAPAKLPRPPARPLPPVRAGCLPVCQAPREPPRAGAAVQQGDLHLPRPAHRPGGTGRRAVTPPPAHPAPNRAPRGTR